jgi:hypothetical protein
MVSDGKKRLIVSCRDELHGAERGLLECYNAKQAKILWTRDKVYPLSLVQYGEHLLVADGSPDIGVYAMDSGDPQPKLEVDIGGTKELGWIFSVEDRLFLRYGGSPDFLCLNQLGKVLRPPQGVDAK